MKFQFDAHLPHQSTAISSVLGVFAGSRASDGKDYATAMQTFDTALFQGVVQTAHGIGNAGLEREGLLARIRAVQEGNGIEPSKSLVSYYGDKEERQCPHFSIEMETGTGKTYVYLRTLFDLHRDHGFAKFIIVVPTVAIREGTLKTLEMTREHFRAIYNQVPYDYFVYDSKKLGKVRQFASSNQLQIMVIIHGTTVREATAKTLQNTKLPDLLSLLQGETRLTRSTLARILIDSDRLGDFIKNPTVFAGWATKAFNKALGEIVDAGVTYEKVEGMAYEQHRFDEDDAEVITAYASRLYEVQNKGKALHDFIEWESEVEKSFAEALDAREEVKLFFKLPRWFQIPTPVGPYNPDWAIMAGDPNKVYLVRETKSTLDKGKRRESENQKIEFGRRHFKALSGSAEDIVDFKDCVSLKEALASLE